MAESIEAGTGLRASVDPGAKGEFTVWVDGKKVASKSMITGFPSDEKCVSAVQKALNG